MGGIEPQNAVLQTASRNHQLNPPPRDHIGFRHKERPYCVDMERGDGRNRTDCMVLAKDYRSLRTCAPMRLLRIGTTDYPFGR